jgi:hypothetical protein
MVGFWSCIYLVFVACGARWMIGSPWMRRCALAGLVLAGLAVQMTIQHVGFGLAKWPFVLYMESSSGYYTAAKRDVLSARDFLARYDQIQADYQKRYGPLHLATHPPGLVLIHYAARELCLGSPRLKQFLLAIQPESARNGFLAVAAGTPIHLADRASIWLVALLTQLASAMTVLPIFGLARRGCGPVAAWFAAALWPLVPAVTIFMPKSDVMYPLFAVTCVMLIGAGRNCAVRWSGAVAAGVVLVAGMFLTFGLVSVVPLVVMTGVLSNGTPFPSRLRAAIDRIIAFAVGCLSSLLILWAVTGHNLLATWWRCYRIHATFYDPGQVGAARTYWPWVAFNLAEFAVAAGIPLMLAAIVGTSRLCGHRSAAAVCAPGHTEGAKQCAESYVRVVGVVAAWWITVVALDLLGKNLGEIARLWIFLMPFAAVAASLAIERIEGKVWLAYLLLILQAVQTIVFAAHVQGFFDPASIKVTPRQVIELGGGERLDTARLSNSMVDIMILLR